MTRWFNWLLLLGCDGALGLQPRPPLRAGASRPAARRTRPLVCGFEVEDVTGKVIEDLGVLNWPDLHKRTEPFEQSASSEEIKMVYCQTGSALLTAEGEEDATVSAGQMVMISDGAVRWTNLAEGGVTLLSATTSTEDEADDAPAAGPAGSDDLSVTEGAVLLAAGLLSGVLISTGVKLFTQG